VSLVTKCVTGDFLQLTFNDDGREGRGGQKVLSKPSADSFAVGQRQKVVSYQQENKLINLWKLNIGYWF
jgi:hypothetical protein